MATDPVCGMEVDEGKAQYSSRHRGRSYFFCSERCKEQFEQEPERYLKVSDAEMPDSRKVVIVGTGQVGATFAFALMLSGVATSIALVDRNREMAEGHAMDLNHGLSFAQPVRIYASDYSACENASVVVITAGAAQKPGESRLDLAQKNIGIFKEIIPKIVRYNPEILLIVTNPVDILTYAALKISGYPMNRVMGSGTVLDTARFRYLLSEHCQVDPRNVHAYVIGEHGDSEVPIWSKATVGGISLREYCPICGKNCSEEERASLFNRVKNAAYEIIDKKGATYYAISLALVRIVGSILRDEKSVLTVSTLLDGSYDIHDVCLSIPAILDRNGISRMIPATLEEPEVAQLRDSAAVLKKRVRTLEL